jgi:anti-sigma regulatory factor (Ser/Thr protein kinase)
MMGGWPDWCYEIWLPSQPGSARRARSFVSHHLVEHRMLHLVEPARLVASELAANAIMHATTPFTVTLLSVDGTVRLAVEDGGALAIGASQASQDQASPVMAVSGRGLAIVDILSQEWGVTTERPGSKIVWASFAGRQV